MASFGERTTYGQCRCCLVNGYHRDLLKTYSNSGGKEVYSDMFLDCFNLYLSGHANLTTLICSSCVQRLTDASQFKAMVLESEQQLLAIAGKQDTLFLLVPELKECSSRQQIKGEERLIEVDVKNEPEDLHDEDHFPDVSLETESNLVEAREPSNLPDIVEGEAALLARFGGKSPPPLPTRAALRTLDPDFHYQLDCLKDKIVRPSMLEDILKNEDSPRLNHVFTAKYIPEKTAHITNALFYLENSNVTPFKSKTRNGFPCFFCRITFDNVKDMRKHQKGHRKSDIKSLLANFGAESLVVYVDTKDLACTICNENIKKLPDLKSHLIKTHKLKYFSEFKDRVIPFVISEDNIFECQVCGFHFETFGSVERHMNVHYRNYVCRQCGSGFVTKYRLKVHVTGMHGNGYFPCTSCEKIFTSNQKLTNHINFVHKAKKRFKCPKCPERFTEYFQRQKHLVNKHGDAPLLYKCNVCDKAFDRRYALSRHMKRNHLEERDFQCEKCPYTCFTNNELTVHMIKHDGERIYECLVCKKAYARKKTLREHMRIHQNDRRFACAVCSQAFVQKCSLKGHMKTHHPECTLP